MPGNMMNRKDAPYSCGCCWRYDSGNRGRSAEKRSWRRELDADADFEHRVRVLDVPGWCPVLMGECPEWCSHTGVAC
ncbi:hypothetical protein SEA_LEWAN_105 [Mycobacterium phage Lewan]|nr:hypothetical protein SEA_LEWAN_105 [Mycobacterium phage Lewan]